MALTQISTAGVKDDAVTAGKIPANAVGTSEIANNAVTSTQIADNTIVDGDIADATITLNKLVHGTSSNDGKFLRANNGADPSFETVTSTTINNNADNRVITGSGTANTLNGEANLTYDGNSFISTQTTSSSDSKVIIRNSNTPASGVLRLEFHHGTGSTEGTDRFRYGFIEGFRQGGSNDGGLAFGTKPSNAGAPSERFRIDSSGRLLLNKTSVTNTTDALTVTHPAGGSNGVTSLTVDANNHTGTHANAFIFTKAKNTYWGGYGFQSSHGHIGAIVGKRNTADDDEKEVRIEIGGTGVNSSEEKTWKFRNNGNLALSAGHVEVASGYGIDFSATSDASGKTSELFDDYEEGTFSFTKRGIASGFSTNYALANQTGKYTKIGRLVTLKGGFSMSGNSGNIAASDYFTIYMSSLPFAMDDSASGHSGAIVSHQGTWWAYTSLGGGSNAKGSVIAVYNDYLSFYVTSVTGSPVRNSNEITFTITYTST